MFDSKFFKNNRKKLCQKVGADKLIIITANGLLQRSGDTTYPFRQDSNFLYLTGLQDTTDAILVLHDSKEFLILRDKTKIEEIFDGKNNCDNIAEISGIETLYDEKEGWQQIRKMRQVCNNVYGIKAPQQYIYNFYTNPARNRLQRRLFSSGWRSQDIIDIRQQFTELRQIKLPMEIAAIKQAISITKSAFQAARSAARPGISEAELQAEFDYIFKQNGSSHAYEPVVAHGLNATTIHHLAESFEKLSKGNWVLIDAGAEYQGYAADITRMIPVKGMLTKRHYEIEKSVKNVLEKCVKQLRPGLKFIDYAKWAQLQVGQELVKLKLTNQADDNKAVMKYFPHLISHSLGLDTHDVFDYHNTVIKENMVLTVEPGIYIPEEGIGVRIEDNILITKKGAINLSEDIPY